MCQIFVYLSDVIKSGCIHPLFWRKDWDEHFKGFGHETYSNNQRSGLLEVSNQSSFYVSSCYFIDQTNRAIYFNNTAESTLLLVETTAFDSCSSPNEGGSLYFSNKGKIVQERVSYYKSTSSKEKHVFYSQVTDKNFFKSSSVFECGNIDKLFWMYLVYGKVEFENISNTFSKAKYSSGYRTYSVLPDSFVKFSNFCNLTENSPDTNSLTWMETKNKGDATFVTSSNFVNQNGKIKILIYTMGSKMTVENCSIFDNICKYTFGTFGGTITVRHCCFDNGTTILYYGGQVTFESNVSSKITNLFNETVYLCRPRIKQRKKTEEINRKFIEASCVAFRSLINISMNSQTFIDRHSHNC